MQSIYITVWIILPILLKTIYFNPTINAVYKRNLSRDFEKSCDLFFYFFMESNIEKRRKQQIDNGGRNGK
jgi:hypothetical protein